MRFIDKTNKKYGRLTVLSHKGKDHNGKHLWECQCSCGNKTTVIGDNLSNKVTQSCGCLRKEFLVANGNRYSLLKNRKEAIMRNYYNKIKRQHRRQYPTDCLTYEKFSSLVLSKCGYCGKKPEIVIKDQISLRHSIMSKTTIKVNNLVQKNNILGFTNKNSVSCCNQCYLVKSKTSDREFFIWIKKLHQKGVVTI